MINIKKRRITVDDWRLVEEFVKSEFKKRSQDTFRKAHERIWKEVDRQVAMKPLRAVSMEKQKADWHNVIELGELAKASEIITADVRRLIFPTTRSWFEAHCEMPPQLDEATGQNIAPSQKTQEFVDGAVRAFMCQQHLDFGFKDRFDLSVKEALHHGSFVVEIRAEDAMLVHSGTGIESRRAPVWHPHSMWNCWPDPSPSVIGANMFYNGSMIIQEYVPLAVLKLMASSQDGWMSAQIPKVTRRKNKNKDIETEDVQLLKFYGDISIRRQDGDIYLPNSKVILANDILVFYQPNSLPYLPIIYGGYERMDVRDPYYTSPLIKLAPMHKMASTLSNRYLDAVDLKTEPPIVYDANDPDFVQNGGPVIAPGAKVATRGLSKYEAIQVGDPSFALQGLQLVLDRISQGTSVDAVRSGAGTSVDQTATESRLKQARGEIRVVDFVDKLEFALRKFLYMAHQINKNTLDVSYAYYNPEMEAPDFMRMTKEALPENVQFEIVGARGVLGEEERAQKMTVITSWAANHPMFAPLLRPIDLLMEAYQDAGVKNPERFLKTTESPELAQANEQMNQLQQQAQQIISQLQQEIQSLKSQNELKAAESARKLDIEEYKVERTAEIEAWKAETQALIDAYVADTKTQMQSFVTTHTAALNEMKQSRDGVTVVDSSATKDFGAIMGVIEQMVGQLAQNTQAITEMSRSANRRKRVVFDDSGRPIGIEPEMMQ